MLKNVTLLFCGSTIFALAGCGSEPAEGPQAATSPSAAAERVISDTKTDEKPDLKPSIETSAPELEVYEPAPDDSEPFEMEAGFAPLSLTDFDAFGNDAETWTATADEIHCTGKPRGYLYSRDDYQNFTWRLEYRFERPGSLQDESKFKGNTGFMVYISGEHKLWPVSLEVQGKHVQMAAIKENGGASPVTVQDDDAVRQSARAPVGQWNRLEIVSHDGSLTVRLNERVISRSEPNFLSSGRIGIQAEDHPFVVRRMRIRRD